MPRFMNDEEEDFVDMDDEFDQELPDFDDVDEDFHDDMISEEEMMDREFQDPGGNSALRRATPSNPRIHPCPTCNEPNKLTKKDVELHYQCDDCADRAEGRGGY